ncbi:hypothetical protein ACFFUT_15480 [Pseudohalocynthiibacter aestuariivivens]|jgi:hypothetical protein|uniref:Uncharacterized protein n=1 Tax=Pseudohalocynthiibacter aestuariivivens TaxID=1591409 RepID=A0ABV5JI98_9RHOB|nr:MULTISPECIES: hypothetical protein [Pseudohalocynthiibacter]MBS9717490.1 hypothetical protein [Pseudohalocynthiibacter aestuariivivens]MCK0102174.1 hypothetical protein [Pseudohalocynthiibacter sp. F2068]
MAEPKKDKPINLGIFNSAGEDGITSAELIAIVLSALWIAAVTGFYVFSGDGNDASGFDSLKFVMTLMSIFLPIAVIWIGAIAARSARVMRNESERLQAAIDAMRHTYVEQFQSAGMGVKPSFEKKLDEIAAAQKMTESALVTFTSSRERDASKGSAKKPAIAATAEASGSEGQSSLALGTPAEALDPPISIPDFIRALHFPETPEDHEGFDALRRALRDRQTAKLVQASQDVLTLLSQDGIYMDDLRPDRARPEIWRSFARGERGRPVAALGGVRDRSSLALTAGRMRQDPIFRDAVHHFLREFDKTFVEFEGNASDEDIAALSNTRTARAFMLLGRVTGTFD